MRIATLCAVIGSLLIASTANAGPTATNLKCLECVEAEELEAGAVGPRELADDAVFATTMLVRADGTPTENCEALLDALVDTSGSSATNRYLIKLEAGIYECPFPQFVDMNPYVDIEGSGQATTVIRGRTLPVVEVPSNAELRQLTVEALGRGIDVRGTASRVADVTVIARVPNGSAAIPFGITISSEDIYQSIEVDLDHVTVRAGLPSAVPSPIPGPMNGTAFQIGGPATVRMTDVDGRGARSGLALVNVNAANVVATASKFAGAESSFRVEAGNTGVLVSSQLLGPLGVGLGTRRCIASYDSGLNVLASDCTSP